MEPGATLLFQRASSPPPANALRSNHSSHNSSTMALFGSPRSLTQGDDWGDFLSTSMLALATPKDVLSPTRDPQEEEEEDEDARAASPLPRRSNQRQSDDDDDDDQEEETDVFAMDKQARRDSMSESLTSSSGSSPSSATAWRPLGRRGGTPRAKEAHPSPHQAHFAGGDMGDDQDEEDELLGRAVHPTLLLEDESVDFFPDRDPYSPSSNQQMLEAEQQHQQQRRVHSDDDAQPLGDVVRPGIMDVDPEYAASCLQVLTSLPSAAPTAGASTLAVVSPFGGGSDAVPPAPAPAPSPSLFHAKSPVIGNRKDSQTWQLSDEEFLTSPRFSPPVGRKRANTTDNVLLGGAGIRTRLPE